MLFQPPLVLAIATGAVLIGVVIADNRKVGRHPSAISPPQPRRHHER
jgi:hypothetical protein